jgi:hypothetical protein
VGFLSRCKRPERRGQVFVKPGVNKHYRGIRP